jgi:hypothetical protein
MLIFTVETKDDDPEDTTTARGVGRGKKKELTLLSRNTNGKVVLPAMDTKDGPDLQEKKKILRSFLTHTYRKFGSRFVLNASHWSR